MCWEIAKGGNIMGVHKIIKGLEDSIINEIAIYAYVMESKRTTKEAISSDIKLPITCVEDTIRNLEYLELIANEDGNVVPYEHKEMVKHGLRPIDHSKELPGEYTERMIALLMEGRKTNHIEKGHDIILKDHTKIEVKMARVSIAGNGAVKQYNVSGLGGNDIYDYLVAVLFPSETNYDLTKATILFVPKREVNLILEPNGKIRINESLRGRKYDWNKFKVTIPELKVIGRTSNVNHLNPRLCS